MGRRHDPKTEVNAVVKGSKQHRNDQKHSKNNKRGMIKRLGKTKHRQGGKRITLR